jgi:hypothetical protein
MKKSSSAVVHLAVFALEKSSKAARKAEGLFEVPVLAACAPQEGAQRVLQAWASEHVAQGLDELQLFVLDPTSHEVLASAEGFDLEAHASGKEPLPARRLAAKPPRIYEVIVMARDDSEESFVVGHLQTAAKDKRGARAAAFDRLWDARLDSTSCAPRYNVERLA